MKSILLIGLGRFGMHIAEKSAELRHEVMAIDINEERVNAALPLVTDAQIGDSRNADFLQSLGVNNYDLCFVAIGDDFQSSLETTSLLKELGAQFVVSRASSDVHAKLLRRLGADDVVYPERQQANWAAMRYSADNIFDYIDLGGDHAIYEVSVPPTWEGKTVGQLNIRKKNNVNILALKNKSGMNMNITPETVFGKNETMLVLGNNRNMQRLFRI